LLAIGTMSDPISHNLYKNARTLIRERGEHCAFIYHGAIELTIVGDAAQQPRGYLFGLPTAYKERWTSQVLVGYQCPQEVVDECIKEFITIHP
jgi:hypothetical protein